MVDRYLDVYFVGESEKMSINLFWTKEDSELIDIFKLQGDKLSGMHYEGEVSVEKILEYLGGTYEDVRKKHSKLNTFIEMEEEDPGSYPYGKQVKDFYDKLATGQAIDKMILWLLLD